MHHDSSVMPWELLDPADAREWLTELRQGLRDRARFVKMIEAIADGRPPAVCPVCQSRFYPSRSDARYCGGTCRTRAHRAKP
jgi:hypothetical protein